VADQFDDFEAFFLAHRRALSRTAYFLTGDDDAAEDLLQSALAKAAAKWERIAHTASPRAYVRQAMLNEMRTRWRRRQRLVEHALAELPEDRDQADVAREVADRQALGDALRQLTKRQRAVLYLRYYEDLSEHATARALGCSLGTVKSQTHHALERLRAVAPELLREQPAREVSE
jgi:RNA polymerase sigma-70 factor (sigma-E family)